MKEDLFRKREREAFAATKLQLRPRPRPTVKVPGRSSGRSSVAIVATTGDGSVDQGLQGLAESTGQRRGEL